jgi:hypothetical protein
MRAATIAAGLVVSIALTAARADEALPFHVTGTVVDGCSCSAPCPCELIEAMPGCLGVGAMILSSGNYQGVDLAGAKIAYAKVFGDWVRIYIDAPRTDQRPAAEAFARAVYKPFGKIEAVRPATIALAGRAGRYTLTVDGGKTMTLTTEPVIGGDKRTPITISNIKNPLNPTVMQGKTVEGSFEDGERSLTLKGSNAYFTDRMRQSGKI